MARQGISLSMTYVVLGLILLTTAVTVILYVTGNIDAVEGITQGQISASQKQLIENQCITQKNDACQGLSAGSPDWAGEATYSGKTCEQWAEDNNVFGPDGTGSIPGC